MNRPTRRTGRPPLREGEVSVSIHVSLPASDFDRICAIAHRRGVSLPAVVRAGVQRLFRADDEEGEEE